jgi:hypothetical protein
VVKIVKRKISKNRYFLAFLITLVVFTLGLLLGLVVESKRIQLIELKDQQQRMDFDSLQLQYQFVDLFGEEKNCQALKKTFEESIQNLEATRAKLENYLQDSNINKKEFEALKREYTLAQLRFWLLTKKTKDICDIEHSSIFYFYADNKECPQCADQATVLTYLKSKLDISLLNFVFDGQFEQEPMIGILKEIYDIKAYPTLIINGKKFEGFTSKEKILKEICPTYVRTKNEICSGYPVVVIS